MIIQLTRISFKHSLFLPSRFISTSSMSSFSVFQMNILARTLATPERFPYVCDTSLDWNHRVNAILSSIKSHQPDIIALQELTDYKSVFQPALAAIGYSSSFLQRPSIHEGNWSGKYKEDGCGLFFKKDLFETQQVHNITYDDAHDRVALVVVLKCKMTRKLILMATTHIWWNANKPEEQLVECRQLNDSITAILGEHQSTTTENIPVVICGDFNNSPQSEIYAYMQQNFLQGGLRSAYDTFRLCTRTEAGDVLVVDNTLAGGPEDEPPHTTVNFRRCWTIDYIWYSHSLLRVTKLLSIPSEEELRAEEGPDHWLNITMASDSSGRLPSGLHGNHNGIPNSVHGSDHIPLWTEFEWLS